MHVVFEKETYTKFCLEWYTCSARVLFLRYALCMRLRLSHCTSKKSHHTESALNGHKCIRLVKVGEANC